MAAACNFLSSQLDDNFGDSDSENDVFIPLDNDMEPNGIVSNFGIGMSNFGGPGNLNTGNFGNGNEVQMRDMNGPVNPGTA